MVSTTESGRIRATAHGTYAVAESVSIWGRGGPLEAEKENQFLSSSWEVTASQQLQAQRTRKLGFLCISKSCLQGSSL